MITVEELTSNLPIHPVTKATGSKVFFNQIKYSDIPLCRSCNSPPPMSLDYIDLITKLCPMDLIINQLNTTPPSLHNITLKFVHEHLCHTATINQTHAVYTYTTQHCVINTLTLPKTLKTRLQNLAQTCQRHRYDIYAEINDHAIISPHRWPSQLYCRWLHYHYTSVCMHCNSFPSTHNHRGYINCYTWAEMVHFYYMYKNIKFATQEDEHHAVSIQTYVGPKQPYISTHPAPFHENT